MVLGPKVLDGQDRRTLREVGVSIDRAGRRITGIEPGEIDQGQHDHNKAVLAVGSAGMLVRRDVWDQLGEHGTAAVPAAGVYADRLLNLVGLGLQGLDEGGQQLSTVVRDDERGDGMPGLRSGS